VPAWVTQQARNLLLVLEKRGRRVRFLLRDRDAKFSRSFDDVFRSEGAEVLVTPVRAPPGERLRGAVGAHRPHRVLGLAPYCRTWASGAGPSVYVEHYNEHRPHRALGLQAPDPPTRLTVVGEDQQGGIRRRDRLGGLLHEYRRAA
jgi:putative transposase